MIWVVAAGGVVCAQEPVKEPAKTPEKPASAAPQDDKTAKAKSEEKTTLPFQVELLETCVRFEANGDSRKEVHTIVKVNDASGARQFARLTFDYNRAFQSVEIPLVKISHVNGGTSEILPSAIGDVPNPAVEKYPAYQDVRVKTVRILGLQEGDTLEYRVITTTTKPPLAPDFWLEHTFDRSGQVVNENYTLDVPNSTKTRIQIAKDVPNSVQTDEGDEGFTHYSWKLTPENWAQANSEPAATSKKPDIVLSTFLSWSQLSGKIKSCMPIDLPAEIAADSLSRAGLELEQRSRDFPGIPYRMVSHVSTVELPLDFSQCPGRTPKDVLSSGYGTSEEKAEMLGQLLAPAPGSTDPWSRDLLLTAASETPQDEIPRPSLFSGVFILLTRGKEQYSLDPSLDVAPLGMIRAGLRGKMALDVTVCEKEPSTCWIKIPETLPFAARQSVTIASTISTDGKLTAKVKYVMRGDNELLLRQAFHQAPKEQWNEVAGLLALSDGFRGHIESMKASDPMETEKPFEVEYEITQPKFVDWSKKPVRIPALLPQIALPDAPGKADGKIELGTPLDVETQMTLKLPEGTAVQTPPATSVTRDYATYASKYDGHLNTVTASRHIHFLMREIPGERAADYNAFTRAVKNDEGQAISLFPAEKPEKK